jgi:hypothetical protein
VSHQAGQLSSDGWWYWEGAQWQSAITSDGRWQWDGTAWVCRVPWSTGRRSAWRGSDVVRLVCVSVAAPISFVLVVLALIWADAGTSESIASLGAWLALFGIWAGLSVRPSGYWWESLLLPWVIAVALAYGTVVGGIAATELSSKCSGSDAPRSQCDTTASGIGGIAIFLASGIALTPFVVLGKTTALVAKRRRSRTDKPPQR